MWEVQGFSLAYISVFIRIEDDCWYYLGTYNGT